MERYEGRSTQVAFPPDLGLAENVSLSTHVSARWFQALYDSPVIFSGLLDAQGTVIGANRLSIEGCGLVRDEVLGAPFWRGGWWSPDPALAEQIRSWCLDAVATRVPLRAVSRYFRGDGSRGMVDLSLVPIAEVAAPPDEPLVYLVATGLDITDMLAEQARREDRLAGESLRSREAEERFRAALDAMIDHVAIARSVRDADGTIVDFEIEYVNRASLDGAGRSTGELIGRRVCELYPSWRESGMLDLFRRVVSEGEPFIGERLPYEDELADGRTIAGYWDLQVSKLDDGYIAASRDVTTTVRDEEAVREAHLLAERERLIVDVLQRAALPGDLPTVPGARIGVHHEPAMVDSPIGGDWYDVFTLGDGRVALVIADVAGHGAEAASHTVQVRNILRTVAVEGDGEPGPVLTAANRVTMALHGTSAPFITCCFAVLDRARGELHWALAGHPPPIFESTAPPIFGSTAQQALDAGRPGPPLGVTPDVAYRTNTTAVASGDRIVLYTDGLIERRGSTIDDDIERLRQAVHRTVAQPPELVAEQLAAELSPGTDDIALLVIDITD